MSLVVLISEESILKLNIFQYHYLPPFSRAPRVSLTPKTPFPFPFKRLPRRLLNTKSCSLPGGGKLWAATGSKQHERDGARWQDNENFSWLKCLTPPRLDSDVDKIHIYIYNFDVSHFFLGVQPLYKHTFLKQFSEFPGKIVLYADGSHSY